MKTLPISTDSPTTHWADHAAEKLLEENKGKEQFVCASGISPSGVIHIGNFREAITVDFVSRALRHRGKKVRFIHSWDDYDALRKVPANLPNPESLEKEMRKPISDIPDPFGEQPSYAAQFEKRFESELKILGICPEFLYQHSLYKAGRYAEGIRQALNKEGEIRKILDLYRTAPLPEDWSCITIYCQTCGRDTTKLLNFVSPSSLNYFCKPCKKEQNLNFEKDPGTKLLWRIDWPMRWAQEQVDFEPGGKDHSSPGGSYETGAKIAQEIFGKKPPSYVQYDFVIAKGVGGKLSSSSGSLLTVSQALEVYEPAVIRWLFASRKPNIDFAIAFDLDVLRAYDDFDRMERIAYGIEEADEKKYHYEKRIYEFSQVEDKPLLENMPVQFPFRHLCNILQIQSGNVKAAQKYYQSLIKTSQDETRFAERATRAWKWITTYAPEDFRFSLRQDQPQAPKFTSAVESLISLLKTSQTVDEESLGKAIFEIIKTQGLNPREFFGDIYQILIGKENGPKLAPFLLTIGLTNATERLEKALRGG